VGHLISIVRVLSCSSSNKSSRGTGKPPGKLESPNAQSELPKRQKKQNPWYRQTRNKEEYRREKETNSTRVRGKRKPGNPGAGVATVALP
jgi:redox-sensitive bicupin YhaK (pirin superfamily)